MNWILLGEIAYIIILILVCARVIYDTQNTTKTLAYLLAVLFLPFIGMIIYFSVGVNYRKRKIYSKNIFNNPELEREMRMRILAISGAIFTDAHQSVKKYLKLSTLILRRSLSPITYGNDVTLLFNGENKFPRVFEDIRNAKNHIHVEYYIFDADDIGCEFIDLLIEKAKEGVSVRFIYDDFGSRQIRKKQVSRLKEAGVLAFPFYKIKLIAFANRLNYRNHRKIIVVDGSIGYVGGINVSDKYINSKKNSLYWRDTHLRIEGPAVSTLQYVFMGDWNYCAGKQLKLDSSFFLHKEAYQSTSKQLVQIVASGPDSDIPLIQQTLIQAINLAKKEILITTPYFIPGESMMDSLTIAASSGVVIKLLIPDKSDSTLVDFAARSYYGRLLKSGAKIFRYKKGFVHAKTIVVDNQLAMVGTANMDIRSFDLNFEVNAVVYDKEIAKELSNEFYNDLKGASEIDFETWKNRKTLVQLSEKIAGLLSPML